MISYYIFDQTIQKGPFTFTQITSMWNQGLLTAEAQYFDDSAQEWRPLSALLSPSHDSSSPTTEVAAIPPVTALQQTHVVLHHEPRKYHSLFHASWVLLVIVCCVSLLPFVGFAAWLVVIPILVVTFVLSIMILSRGGTLKGIGVLLGTLVLVPLFVFFAPFVSSGIVALVAAVAPEVAKTIKAKNDAAKHTSTPPSKAAPQSGHAKSTDKAADAESATVQAMPSASPEGTATPMVKTNAPENDADTSESEGEPAANKRGPDTLYSPDAIDSNAITADTPQLKGEIFPITRSRRLTSADIQGWPDAKLQYAINEMYARHDADFGNKKIKQFFLAFDWYTPIQGVTLDEAEKRFSENEKANLELLASQRSGGRTASAAPAAPTPPSSSAKSFDEIMRENDNWASQGMKHDVSRGNLNLKTSLQGGPTSMELEELLQNFVEYNMDIYPFRHLDERQRSAVESTYALKQAHNKITAAEVTNEYTKSFDGEMAYVYELNLTVNYSVANIIGYTFSKEGFTVKVSKRGRKWYVE